MNRAEHTPVSFILSLALLFFPTSVFSTHRNVPHQYQTIQSAINASKPGDTVLVDEGIYYENILIKKNIVVASRFILDRNRSHIEQTIIDGSKPTDTFNASVVRIQGNTDTTCVLMGFTLRGGTGTYNYIVENNVGTPWISGGGICILNAGARIAHNFISANILSTRIGNNFTFGGGISTIDTTNGSNPPPYLIIEQNTVTGNRSAGDYAESGGIFTSQPGVIRHNVITENRTLSRRRAPGGGLTVNVANYEVLIDGNYISRNIAGIGAGILLTSGFIRQGRIFVTNNIISDNEADEVGGGSNVGEQATAIFINNTIVNNSAKMRGGGINNPTGSHVSLLNNIIWSNSPDQIGAWQVLKTEHNLIADGYPGLSNVSSPPLFLSNDTLYRLSAESPAVGIGTSMFRLMGKAILFPSTDYHGAPRNLPAGTDPDLGAIESEWSSNEISSTIKNEWKNAADAHLTLTIDFQQLSAPIISPDTLTMLQEGRFATTITVNNNITYLYNDTTPELSFVLPPGKNLFEFDLKARGRDLSKGLVCTYRMEGLDWQNNALFREWKYLYRAYSDLRPGSYTLLVFPQDENNYVVIANKIIIHIVVLPYWYQRWWAYALFAFGVILFVYGVYRNRIHQTLMEQRLLTEHLQSEKFNEMNSTKSRFLANVSHELRTPLTMIIGPIDSMLSQPLNKEFSDQLGYVQRNARKLLQLIEQLLQFSRLEAGSIALHVSQMDVIPLFRLITGYFTSQAAKKQVEMRFNAPSYPINGMIDAEKVEHIMQNCISNALKYTPSGGLIEVRIWQEKNEVVFSVKDTGEGIAPEHLPHVFDRFYRADPTHKTEGIGIGLSLTKELVEIHHGAIYLDSELGTGTTVTVRLPLSGYNVSDISPVPYILEEFEPLHKISSINDVSTDDQEELPIILIAEDNDDARGFIKLQLLKLYTVLEATDGADALNKTKFQIPDLVISDVMMPKKNGLELCQELKRDERTSHIPVILLTALSEKEDRLKGLTTGADDFLVKPFDAEELLTRVHNLLENRKKIREQYGKAVSLKPDEILVTSLNETFLIKAKAIVTNHIAEPEFGVEIFAHDMFLSRTQLQRKIKSVTNLTPGDFIRLLRLQRAKELLEKNAGSIAEIADSVGFTNHSYFAKCFQEQFGLLPNQIRIT
ncbi:MAG: ATP-binding protein [Bacteroidota bacterium]